MRRLSNLCSVICGAFLIWMAYGFASAMIHQDLQGTVKVAEVWHRFTTDGGGAIGFGVLLMGTGIWLAFHRPKSSPST